MNQQELANWLFENGGPAIRYRTATELMPSSGDVDIGQLREELLQSQLIRTWLERLTPGKTVQSMHGHRSTAFENVMGKLTDLGCRQGMAELDQRTMPFRQWLQENAKRPSTNVYERSNRKYIAVFMARAGYTDEPSVGIELRNYLEALYDFTRNCNYDIYVDPSDYPPMPRSFQKRPLVNPAVTRGGNRLPSIYHIIGLAAYLVACGTENDWLKGDTIISYILNDQYQKLEPGYGVARSEDDRYRAMGWSVHLPGFFDAPPHDTAHQRLTTESIISFVQRLLLMGQFPVAREHPWFVNSLDHLDGFKTENGTYLFPRSYLPEKTSGYWVRGARMGLEQNRRIDLTFELESTFWMAKLHSLKSA